MKRYLNFLIFGFFLVLFPLIGFSQTDKPNSFFPNFNISTSDFILIIIFLLIFFLLLFSFGIYKKTAAYFRSRKNQDADKKLENFDLKELETLKKLKSKLNNPSNKIQILLLFLLLSPNLLLAQDEAATREGIFSEYGVIITIILILIPLILSIVYLIVRIRKSLKTYFNKSDQISAQELSTYIKDNIDTFKDEEIDVLKEALSFELPENSISGHLSPKDPHKLITNISTEHYLSFFARKRNPIKRPKIDPKLTSLIMWFLGSAIFWLLVGTTVGEYLGIKFVAPEIDNFSWLSFGRLRPVHTNLVFWAWASLGMLGLGYYVVPTVGNTSIASLKHGWYSLFFINLSHLLGTLSLMAGYNNGGGEYREYVWPIMIFFMIGLSISMVNYYNTIAMRKTKEIYISNWYISSALVFIVIIAVISYLPFWQDGIGETIIQGYYMHQAVGLWFMMFCLGLLYYFLPQQFNKPIYSYSLGILAFWTQILFYTLIGTHHFVFSALPWWLQTVAIVGSVGMLIPVTSGTINFLMTFKGDWTKVSNSYSLPFFLVGVIYYFTGSYQGTAEAFRSTNLIWHFSDFTIAHSHITMYGIISFILFAGIYAIVPRLTGNEPPQLTVGAHFWLALVGLQFYTIPLMIGGTLKGLSWAEGKPFIDSVVLMGPYWLWRAIGGSMMLLSHFFLGYNFYKMLAKKETIDVRERAFNILEKHLIALETEENSKNSVQ
ncbi:MAG: cbb3-type cytochrome c oxidase subunit I [Sphingobacteriales bacterium]|nr:cbb3-type cytochrome c oxidase subunit I [Sphingobacteriales bacterium]